MLKLPALAALALVCTIVSAEARHRSPNPAYASCIPTGDVMRPCAYQPNFLAGVRSINITLKRGHATAEARPARRAVRVAHRAVSNYGAPTPSLGYSVARPARYIAGRLVCAINVGAALAERGIRGTGSALAHSYDRWGHASDPTPGAVAVTDRRGGGHVAIVSRVEGSRVFVWNPGSRGRGWAEIEYTNRHARYRVASN